MAWERGVAHLRSVAGAQLTYDDTGVSLRPPPPPAGWRGPAVSAVVGSGEADFASAVGAVLHWRMHARSGLRVEATTPEARVGSDVALGLGVGGLRLVFACRVVAVVDEPDAGGFAYGTLPRHPECGEESFVVRREPGRVVLEVRAVSRPAWRSVALAGPVGAGLQRLAVHGYVRAVRAEVADAGRG